MAIRDPDSIPNLAFWFSAEAEVDYAQGATVTLLHNQKGSSSDAAAVGANVTMDTTAGPGGGRALRWNNTAAAAGTHFNLPDVFSAASQGEIVRYFKPAVGSEGYNSTDYFSSAGNLNSHHPYSGRIYEGALSAGRYDFAPPSDPLLWHRYATSSIAGDQKAYFNGALAASAANAYSAVTNPRFGQGYNLFFLGLLTCLVGYTRVLTSAERADLDAWLVANPSGGKKFVPPPSYVDLNMTDGKTLVAPVGASAPAGFKRALVSSAAPTPTYVGQLWLDNDE